MDPAAMQVLHHVLEARKKGAQETVSLPGMDLRGAQLLRADLVAADLSGAGLDHAQLAGAKLGQAQLRGTLLQGADLGGADLTGADLRDADLTSARLEGASLADADLRGATIEGVVGEPSTIAGARIDHRMAERSALSDEAIISLWRMGAVIDDLPAFEASVQSVCRAENEDVASDVGPSPRRVADVELEARRQRVREDGELPPSARASQESVRIAISEIVEHAARADTPMSMRTLRLVSATLTPEMVSAPPFRQGEEVLGVTLDTQIGQGNAAFVWRGTDGNGDTVAVKLFKVMRSGIGLTLPSYRRGVSVMNRLHHVDGVIDLRCLSLNQLGFVMDHAANGSAVDLPALGWKVASAVEWFEKLCRIVAAAHDEGVLHRCLKPENILLDEDLNPLLSDFDMADLPTLATERTDAGGYRAYAAPEELLDTGTQSPTADIFSLGRILHFLLIGEDPPLSVTAVPELSDLKKQPAGLSRIIRKCTMRAPEARYQWVSELLGDLERYEDYEQVGLEGGPEANYLPYRISSLSHKKPWLGARKREERSDEGTLRPAPQRGDDLRDAKKPRNAKRRGGKTADEASEAEPLGVARNVEKLIGAVASVMLLAMALAVLLGDPADAPALATRLHIPSAIAGGLMTLLIRRASSSARLWRFVWLAIGAVLFYLLNLPGLIAG